MLRFCRCSLLALKWLRVLLPPLLRLCAVGCCAAAVANRAAVVLLAAADAVAGVAALLVVLCCWLSCLLVGAVVLTQLDVFE